MKQAVLAAGFLLFSCAVWAGEAGDRNEVKALDNSVRQDGSVEESEAKAFAPDETVEEGDPPTRVLRLRKEFKPPAPFRFRPFRPEEKDKEKIRQALEKRKWKLSEDASWAAWLKEPSYVDIWFDPEEMIAVVDPTTGYDAEPLVEGPDLIRITALLADPQKACRFPLRFDGNLLPPAGGGGGKESHWAAKIAGGIDLDVDSDNDAGVFGAPQRDPDEKKKVEEPWENDRTKPGKFIPRNDGDEDEDLIPGFADGFGRFGGDSRTAPSARFVPAILDVSPVEKLIDWEKAKLRVQYKASPPEGTQRVAAAGGAGYRPAPGLLRLWSRQAEQSRDPRPVAEGGHFIPGQEGEDGQKGAEFKAEKLLGRQQTVTLYLEGIGEGATDGTIRIEFDPRGEGEWMMDEVRVTVVGVDADVDSDNNNGTNPPDRSPFEDRIEDAAQGGAGQSAWVTPLQGKLLAVNDGDADGDNLPDLFDGFGAVGGRDAQQLGGCFFDPLILEIPQPLDLEKCRLEIEYDASDPKAVRVTRAGNRYSGQLPGKGALRIWRRSAASPRNALAVTKGGDFVASGVYEGEALKRLCPGRTVTLYLEAVRQVSKARIRVRVDPDGKSGFADWTCGDAVRVSTVRLESTRWLVTHDPNFEKYYAQARPEFYQQAKGMGNTAIAVVRGGVPEGAGAELWSRGHGAHLICKGAPGARVGGASSWLFRTWIDSGMGAKTDPSGVIYVEGKPVEGVGEYDIRLMKGTRQVGAGQRIWLGPIVEKFALPRSGILEKSRRVEPRALNPLTHGLGEEKEAKEGAYGMNISYELSSLGPGHGVLGLFPDTEGSRAAALIRISNDTGGQVPGVLESPVLLGRSGSVFRRGTHTGKWEGYTGGLMQFGLTEDFETVLLAGQEAEARVTPWGSPPQSAKGLSPECLVGEGDYGMEVGAVLAGDLTQKQWLQVKFKVRYR